MKYPLRRARFRRCCVADVSRDPWTWTARRPPRPVCGDWARLTAYPIGESERETQREDTGARGDPCRQKAKVSGEEWG